MDRSARGYLEALAAEVAGVVGERLVGAYAHGSLVLGGYRADRSDVDVLVVTDAPLSSAEQAALATALSEDSLPCPAVGLELSVVTLAVAATPSARPAYELHVTTAANDRKVIDGHARDGDPDLVLHVAVCRAAGVLVGEGRPPEEVFAEVPRPLVLAQLADELAWATDNAPPEYTVLNACRALRYAVDGTLVSKVDGGRWALTRVAQAERTFVHAALARQTGADPTAPLDHEAARPFALATRDVIRLEA